jgi:two-component system, LytTR family, sensor kinase
MMNGSLLGHLSVAPLPQTPYFVAFMSAASPYRSPSRPVLIAADILVWGFIATILAIQNYTATIAEGAQADLFQSFVLQVATYGPWAIFTPLLYFYFRRFPIDRLLSVRTLLVLPGIAAACIALQIGSHTIAMALCPGPSAHPRPFWSMYASMLEWISFPSFLTFSAIVGGCHAVNYYQRFRERERATVALEKELAEAHLQALHSQLQPHFFFNTLHAIASLVRDKQNDAAINMIARLSDLFRLVLAQEQAHRIPLRRELEFLSAYLEIEKVRFSDRLRVEMNIPDETLDVLVPTLILQPLVENAIKYGMSTGTSPGLVRIASQAIDGRLKLSVQNEGSDLSPGWQEKPGAVGVRNTRRRLKQLYGDRHHFDLREENQLGVIAELLIPLEYGESDRNP